MRWLPYILASIILTLIVIFTFGFIIQKQMESDHQQKMVFFIHALFASTKNSSVEPEKQTIQFIRKYNHLFPYILDIALINTEKGITSQFYDAMDQMIISEHQMSLEEKLLLKAVSAPHGVQKVYSNGTSKIIQTYIPVFEDENKASLIAVVTSDYNFMFRSWLNKLRIFEIVLFCLLAFSVAILMVANFRIQTRQEAIIRTQKDYSQNIQSLFNTIREYKHDMNHHIYALTGLCELKAYDELEKYLKNLAKIHTSFNSLIKINIPALRGYIQTKIAQATENNIEFEYHFEGLDKVYIDLSKATDLVRIVGNIVDNAFDAVKSNAENIRKVTLIGKLDNHSLVFYIYNNGSPIQKELLLRIFERGFSTKKNKENSGIGLSIVKALVSKHKGKIEVQSDTDGTSFAVRLPLSPNEIMET